MMIMVQSKIRYVVLIILLPVLVATGTRLYFFADISRGNSNDDAAVVSFGRWLEHAILFQTADRTYDDHTDASRAGVGSTALKIAAFRAMESKRTNTNDEPGRPLVRDEVANALFSFSPKLAWRYGREFAYLQIAVTLFPYRHMWLVQHLFSSMSTYTLLQDVMAVRTVVLDQEILNLCCKSRISSSGEHSETTTTSGVLGIGNYDDDVKKESSSTYRQLVIVGAGLDARSIRLCRELESFGVQVYELDFPSMITGKWNLFESVGYSKPDFYHAVPTDFSLQQQDLANLTTDSVGHWPQQLVQAGFDPYQPSIVLAEGLTGYLTEDELTNFLSTIANDLSRHPSSILLATFVGVLETAQDGTLTHATRFGLHRYRTDTPCSSMVEPLFGPCQSEQYIGPLTTNIMKQHGMASCSILESDYSYSIIKAIRQGENISEK